MSADGFQGNVLHKSNIIIMKKLLMIVPVVVAMAVAGSPASGFSTVKQSQKKVSVVASKDQELIKKAKEAILYKLKDPASAQFRNVHIYKDDPTIVRGEVNAKNSYGGYDGFDRFYYDSVKSEAYFSKEIYDLLKRANESLGDASDPKETGWYRKYFIESW